MMRRRQRPKQVRLNRGGRSINSVIAVSPSSPSIRILVADRYGVIRAGICVLLQKEPDLTVVSEADNADDVLAEAKRTQPDIIIMNYELLGISQAKMCTKLFRSLPAVRIVALVRDDAAVFHQAVEAGVHGILRENMACDELLKAVRTVAKGCSYLGAEAVEKTFHLLRHGKEKACIHSGLWALSPQELRIISFIAEGDTNKEIAEKLGLSDKTVKNYVANMFLKLEIGRRTQAAALYLKAQSPRLKTGRTISIVREELGRRDELFNPEGK